MKRIGKTVLCMLLCAALFLPGTVYASGGDEPDAKETFSASGELPVGEMTVQSVSAESAVLTDLHGTVLFEKNADARMPMASTTKIMTALTAIGLCEDLDQTVKVPKEAIGVEGSSVYLYEGEALTVRELLYAMLMESANDAAAAVAVSLSGSIGAFADEMNRKAAELHLDDTHFVNPHGLDAEGHYTTAKDLAAMTAAALRNHAFAEIVSTYKKEIPLRETEGVRLLVNHNRLLKTCEGCIGVKTGYTMTAGRCLVSACERNGGTLICVTLSAPDDWNDHQALYDWGFSRFETVTLSEAGEQYAVLPVVGGVSSAEDGSASVPVRNTEGLTAVVLRGGAEITKTVELPRFLYAPVKKGSMIGRVIYYDHGRKLGELPLYAVEDVALYEKPTLWKRIKGLFQK